MTKAETSITVRHEPMRIAGKKVDAEGVVEVRYPWNDTVIGTVPASKDRARREPAARNLPKLRSTYRPP
jgi:hypothetical protein